MTVRMNWIGNVVASFHQASAGGSAKTGLLRSQSEGTGFVGHSRIGPFAKSAPYEKLVGYLAGAYLRRINNQQRLVY